MNTSELLALNELFQRPEQDELNPPTNAKNPSNLCTINTSTSKLPIGQIVPMDEKAIWSKEELFQEEYLQDYQDTRLRPSHEILYKQDVMTEDTFLGMSEKTALTSDCTSIVVKVVFENHKIQDISLKVYPNFLIAESNTHILRLHLPNTVCENDGNATFEKNVLSIQLPIILG